MSTAWYDSNDPSKVARGGTWRVMAWILGVLAFLALVSVSVWGFRVATSDTAGQGNAVIQKNDANNRIAAQQKFETMFQDIVASDRKITVAAAALAGTPGDRTLQTNLTGTINYCLQAVGDYNAAARSYTAEDFRASDLPAQINLTDSTTDCKE
jgi:hypothetical protein